MRITCSGCQRQHVVKRQPKPRRRLRLKCPCGLVIEAASMSGVGAVTPRGRGQRAAKRRRSRSGGRSSVHQAPGRVGSGGPSEVGVECFREGSLAAGVSNSEAYSPEHEAGLVKPDSWRRGASDVPSGAVLNRNLAASVPNAAELDLIDEEAWFDSVPPPPTSDSVAPISVDDVPRYVRRKAPRRVAFGIIGVASCAAALVVSRLYERADHQGLYARFMAAVSDVSDAVTGSTERSFESIAGEVQPAAAHASKEFIRRQPPPVQPSQKQAPEQAAMAPEQSPPTAPSALNPVALAARSELYRADQASGSNSQPKAMPKADASIPAAERGGGENPKDAGEDQVSEASGRYELEAPVEYASADAIDDYAEETRSASASASSRRTTAAADSDEAEEDEPEAVVADAGSIERPRDGFNAEAAARALAGAAARASSCKQADGPTGSGSIRVVFDPNGGVSSAGVLSAPFVNSPVGRCIESAFMSTQIPPYRGSSLSTTYTFAISE